MKPIDEAWLSHAVEKFPDVPDGIVLSGFPPLVPQETQYFWRVKLAQELASSWKSPRLQDGHGKFRKSAL